MIAAVIINFHEEERTVNFVRNEMAKLPEESRLIVVDNESSAASLAFLSENLPDAVILPSDTNLGFAKANNLGAEYAVRNFLPDCILFSNNDIRILEEDCVERLAAKLHDEPRAGAIGPKVIGVDGTLQSPSPYQSFSDRHILLYWSNLFMSRARRKERFGADYARKAEEGFHYLVSGCFFMVDAKAWVECGGMDPSTFLYAEEMILSERLKAIGKGVFYYPSVSVVHEHGATTGRHFDKRRIRQLKFESECHYYRKYVGTPAWQIFLAKITYGLKNLFGR